jgi:hypothetical protein
MIKVNEYKNSKNIYNVYEDGEMTVIEIVDIATGTNENKPFKDSQIATDYLMYKMCNN